MKEKGIRKDYGMKTDMQKEKT